MRQISRRQALGAITTVSLGSLLAACGSGDAVPSTSDTAPITNAKSEAVIDAPPPPAPTPTPAPPFVIHGYEVRPLMAGTPHQNDLHIFGTGQPGPIILALGGVHGNEPGGWLAADTAIERLRPAT